MIMDALILEIPIQVFTNDMGIARSLMGRNDPNYDDVVQISEDITVVYKQHFNYLISTASGLGPHIDFTVRITDEVSDGEVAEAITSWLQAGKAGIFSFARVILDLTNLFETRLAIEKVLGSIASTSQ